MENANATQTVKFTVITGSAEAKPSATLWTGRQVGKQPRKDIQLSQAINACSAAEIAAMPTEKLATLLTDETAAYIRRVKLQRMELGNTLELSFSYTQMLDILTSPAARTKRLVSTSTVRALLLASEYRDAAAAVLGVKLDAWKRVFGSEFAPLATANDASVQSARAGVRDTVVIRCLEIAAVMPECEHKLVLEAVAELLAELPTAELDDSI